MSDNTSKNPEPIDRVNWRVNDFCDAHGIGRTSFYEEVNCGKIKVIKYGKRTLIPDSQAKAFQLRLLSETEG
jgi:hypothetical protein